MNRNGKLYHFILEVANKASKIPGVKALLKPIYYPFKKHVEESHRKKLMQNGLEVLQRFDKCMSDNGIDYTLAYGTLLGAVREKGFIKHDLDTDVFVWGDQYSPNLNAILKDAGFDLVHYFIVEDGTIGREETYMCEGVSIDIFYLHEDGGRNPYCCDFLTIDKVPTFKQCMQKYGRVLARKQEVPITKQRVKAQFESIELYIPENAHNVLECLYGADYMIPNPEWTTDSYTEYVRVWTEKNAYYYE